MSPQSFSKGPFRKPRPDIYTVLLAIALAALIVGCVMLFLEVHNYGDEPYQLSAVSPSPAGAPEATFAQSTPPRTAFPTVRLHG